MTATTGALTAAEVEARASAAVAFGDRRARLEKHGH
jgi:hypothetical protein